MPILRTEIVTFLFFRLFNHSPFLYPFPNFIKFSMQNFFCEQNTVTNTNVKRMWLDLINPFSHFYGHGQFKSESTPGIVFLINSSVNCAADKFFAFTVLLKIPHSNNIYDFCQAFFVMVLLKSGMFTTIVDDRRGTDR